MLAAKQLQHHFLLSGDADGAIILWELTLADRKVLTFDDSILVTYIRVSFGIFFKVG